MFKPLSFYIGLRYTGAHTSNSLISVIALISTLGLMLGVAVLITVLSVMNGFERELQTRILGMVTHVSVHGSEPVKDWRSLAKNVTEHPNVVAASPFVELQGMLAHGGQVTGAMVNGISPPEEKQVSIVGEHMWHGELESLESGAFNIVLGYGVARELGVDVGDQVVLVLPEASLSPAGVTPRFKRFHVTGIFRVKAEVDSLLAYVHVDDAARLARQPNTVEGVRLRLDDLFKAPQVGWELSRNLEGYYWASDWTRTHGNLFQAVQMEKTMMTLLLSFIVAVAAFNIVSSQVMLVTEKRGNIAVLRTLGATPASIMRIFIVQGTLIGFAGTALGVGLGVLLALNISDIGAWIEQSFNADMFTSYFVNYLPSELRLSDVVTIALIAMGISFSATLYPAWRASRVAPAEALRYE